MLLMQLARGTNTRSFSIRDAGVQGWKFVEERDHRPIRTLTYTDWHRVERAATLIGLEVSQLEREGWIVTRESSRLYKPIA